MTEPDELRYFLSDGPDAVLFELDDFSPRGVLTFGEYDADGTTRFERLTSVTFDADRMAELGEALLAASAHLKGNR